MKPQKLLPSSEQPPGRQPPPRQDAPTQSAFEDDQAWNQDFALVKRDPAVRKSFEEFAKIAPMRVLGNWTDAEAAIVYHYSTDLEKIEKLNRQLRAGRPDEHNRALRRLLDKALSKAPVHEGRVYRKITIKGDASAFLKRYAKGAVVTEDAFTSATHGIDDYNGRQGNVGFIFAARTARKIESIAGKPSEHEVLFRTGSRFEVLDVKPMADRIEILAREI